MGEPRRVLGCWCWLKLPAPLGAANRHPPACRCCEQLYHRCTQRRPARSSTLLRIGYWVYSQRNSLLQTIDIKVPQSHRILPRLHCHRHTCREHVSWIVWRADDYVLFSDCNDNVLASSEGGCSRHSQESVSSRAQVNQYGAINRNDTASIKQHAFNIYGRQNLNK